MFEVVLYLYVVVFKVEKELVLDQVVILDRIFFLVGSLGSELVIKDDVFFFGFFQKEKGIVIFELYMVIDGRDGLDGDSNDFDKQSLEDSAVGLFLFCIVLDFQFIMGNISFIGFGGEYEGFCFLAVFEVLNIEEGIDFFLLYVSKVILVFDFILIEEGKSLVVLEGFVVQG